MKPVLPAHTSVVVPMSWFAVAQHLWVSSVGSSSDVEVITHQLMSFFMVVHYHQGVLHVFYVFRVRPVSFSLRSEDYKMSHHP
jgi:hypothetical protein